MAEAIGTGFLLVLLACGLLALRHFSLRGKRQALERSSAPFPPAGWKRPPPQRNDTPPVAQTIVDRRLRPGRSQNPTRDFRVEYVDGYGEVTIRDIYVFNWETIEGKTYFNCWCFERGDNRTFRADRILELTDLRGGRS